MDFSTSPDQDALVETARRFAKDRLGPFYKQREREAAIHRETIREMGRLGLLGIELPEEHGGLGQDCVTAALVLEALCAEEFNVGYVTVTISLLGPILARYGQPEVAGPLIRGMVDGELIPAIALTEPGGGSDAANIALRAERDGDDFVLNGEKTSISLATQADFAVVFVRTGTVESRARGISAFAVPLDLPGITKTAFEDLGSHSVGRGSLFFDDVRVPATHLLGDENRAFMQIMEGFDYSRGLLGIQCLSIAKRSLEETWEHARNRETFGKPLTAHQGVTFPLAEAETQLQACRLLCLQTLWLKDHGLPHTTEAAMCKWWGPKLAFDIIQTCLLTHGHGGYSAEMPYEQRLRDVLGLQIGDGTAQIMKLIIARQKAGRHAVAT
jgi:cyclohexanecarboxyl-CoA dehydrogenase